jgi:DNA repair exonuclease SbcCD ATPase subunit
MYINTYGPRNIEEIETSLESFRASLSMLTSLQEKGFKTINDAWRTVCKTQVTKRDLEKFAALLGDEVEADKDSRSWEWFSKYGGTRTVTFYTSGNSWKANKKILTMAIKEDLNIERHYCGGSYNIEEHTIDSLISACKESIKDYEKALTLKDSIDQRIKDYEAALKKAVEEAFDTHIKPVYVLVNSRSV